MKKFEIFLENIGLKNTSTGEKKTLGKIIFCATLILIIVLLLVLGKNLLKKEQISTQEMEFNLKGKSTMVLYVGQEYKEPGYEAYDEYGKDISNKVVLIGKVNTNIPGIYEINYKLSLSNSTITKTRTVTVINQSEALFELVGEKQINIKKGEKYNEEGYIIILPGEHEPEKYITVTGEVNENETGTYHIIYKIEHPAITKELVRTINILGEVSIYPSITLIGGQNISLKINDEYQETGYYAYDSIDGDITNKVVVTNKVKNGLPGLYEIKYTVKNSRGYEVSKSRIARVLTEAESMNISPTYGKFDEYVEIKKSHNNVTKDDVTLEITVKSDDVKALILPNNMVTTSKTFKYTVKENGNYIIVVEANDGTLISGTIKIDNIDRQAPSGTCQAIYQNGKVKFTVNATDYENTIIQEYESGSYKTTFNSANDTASSGIAGYNYYNGETYSGFQEGNTYESKTSKPTGYRVIVKDKIGNSTEIECTVQQLATVTAIKIVGETKAKPNDVINLEVVFKPEYVENRKVKWEIIKGNKFGKIDENGTVTINSDKTNITGKDDYIIVRATSQDGNIPATHQIDIYLEETGSSSSGEISSSQNTAALTPNGIKLMVGQEYNIDITEYKKIMLENTTSETKDVQIIIETSNKDIVSVDKYKIKGEKVGNAKIKIMSGKTLIKEYDVAVVDPKCGKSAQYMKQTYKIGIKDAGNGKIMYGSEREIPYKGEITISKNQVIKIKLELTQKCGETQYLTRTTADGEKGWQNYFNAYSRPFVNRYDSTTFQYKMKEFEWIIIPKKLTSGKYIALSQTTFQSTTAFPEIKSFGYVNVKVVEDYVNIGTITEIETSNH